MEAFSAVVLLALRLLMVLALYAFLGWAFFTLWRDLKSQAQATTNQKVPGLQVTLLGAGEASQVLRFTAPDITIGRHPSCEWMLADETVSSRHARLSYHHEQWWVEDLDSRNGTFLNSASLTAPAVLTNNDQVRCGEVSFTVQLEDFAQEQQ
jgi:pSer/pThr/pTyr-binding forkhead associated (FHA) protein